MTPVVDHGVDDVEWMLLGAAMRSLDSLKQRVERDGDFELLGAVNTAVHALHEVRRAAEAQSSCPACGGRCIADRARHSPL